MSIPYTKELLRTIERELAKREKTYPKLIERRKRAGEETEQFSAQLQEQSRLLREAAHLLSGGHACSHYEAQVIEKEIVREMKMRQRVYPRFVFLKRITAETMLEQLSAWENLLLYFRQEYLP